MRHSFSSCIRLEVRTPPKELSDIHGYLIEKLVGAWKDDYNSSSNASFRGNFRLEQHLEDNALTIEDMSERLKKIKPYGMAEMMKA